MTMLVECLSLFLFVLKICGFVDLSWYLVFAPLVGLLALKIFAVIAFAIFAYWIQGQGKQFERLWKGKQLQWPTDKPVGL